jgi:hypothetical protein
VLAFDMAMSWSSVIMSLMLVRNEVR